ncbi:hypothetical protein HYS50_02660 [Candidatus Woesearchaeota archaeon]|nr:hypothetical protein [Candidatus Woesearchaeota archaeon]
MTKRLDLDSLLRKHNPDDEDHRLDLVCTLAEQLDAQGITSLPPDRYPFVVTDTVAWLRLKRLITYYPDFGDMLCTQLNASSLQEFSSAIEISSKTSDKNIKGILYVITAYQPA